MSTLTSPITAPDRISQPARLGLWAYFFSDRRRSIQTALGLIWLLDGVLQFQSFMYGPGFIRSFTSLAPGEPSWVASTVLWGAHTMQHQQVLFNTLAALIQVGIGMGILWRRTTKQALLVSFAWALVIWWFGEAFGMLFTNTANPLTGAPGAVLLYAFVGALVWPNRRPGGLLGLTGARALWAGLWCTMGGLWLLAANSSPNSTHDLIKAAPSGARWLTSLQANFADLSQGHGLSIALALAALSIAIGLCVAFNRAPRVFLALAIVLNLVYWVVGQGGGGLLAGAATDPNSGPLFVLLALAFTREAPAGRRGLRNNQ